MHNKVVKFFIFGILGVFFQGICLSGCSNYGCSSNDTIQVSDTLPDNDTLAVIDTVLVLQPNCVLTTDSPVFCDSLFSLLQRDSIKSITYPVGKVIDEDFFKKLIPFVDIISENSDKIIQIEPYVIDPESIPYWTEAYQEWYYEMCHEPAPNEDLEPYELVRFYHVEHEALTGEELKSAEILRLNRYYLKGMWLCHPMEYVVVEYDSKRFLVRKEFEGILFTKYGYKTYIYEKTNSIYDLENAYPPPYINLCVEDSIVKIYPKDKRKWLNQMK